MEHPTHAERPRPLRRAAQIAAAAALAWLGLVAFLALGQQGMIYFPTQADEPSLLRAAAGSGLEPWHAADGTLAGFRSLAPADDPRPRASVLVLHGNAGFALDRAGYVQLLREAAPGRALSVHILEYPGYGARPGSPSQNALIDAAAAALDALPPGEPAILLGESIGSGVAAGLAARAPGRVSGLLMVTPFDSLAAVAKHHYPLLPMGLIMRDQFPAAEWLQNFRAPAVFFVAGADDIVPPQFGQKLHDAYPGPKLLAAAPAAGHNDIVAHLSPEDWRKALDFVLNP